ncbi:A/G-specific adenine glycosylase [Persicitalea jodogahamensis]|uniref:Adenine DNA glycosylase n=1 Tax=Persicitalea jodogahamensis TaxID=402147 RepID=A0A8J3D277_9BACT|nr:A/G-specific adenine glycosylase [Persicitalea jodogahamensis]GHB57100.1 A/G-specific adenine glycosylase [Persicitalea jodogahamensis]
MPASSVHKDATFSQKLIQWYHRHHRDLPWRQTTDPYKIWLSEIILQQTRVVQGMPYYLRFVEKYPTVQDLARADEQDVLRLWQGLGYYSRARNMHYTARQVVGEFGGKFPDSYSGLLKLKGVGEYTAAAIASFAFNEAVPAVDGNVYRVLARIFGIKTDIMHSSAKREFTAAAQRLIPADDPATFNQAMIEFGAIQCQPVAPDCLLCPFNESCYAFENGMQSFLPVKSKKAKARNRYLNYLVLEKGGLIAMKERIKKDVWKGLYDFPIIETLQEAQAPEDLAGEGGLESLMMAGRLIVPDKTYVHLLSHQKLHVKFWQIKVEDMGTNVLPDGVSFYNEDQIDALPKPILIDTFIKEQFFS